MKNIAVFASGFGSNFEAILEAAEQGQLQAHIALLVVDKPACFAVERAQRHNVPIFAFNPKDYSSKEEYESLIVNQLEKYKIDLIALAGYMRLVGNVLLQHYEGRIINIHPALLPAFPGTHAIEKAYDYGVKIFGITIHYVDAGMDTGKIIAQDCFKMKEGESVDEVEARIHQLEHFKETFHPFANYTVYPAVAALKYDEGSDVYASKKGMFVLHANGEDMFDLVEPQVRMEY